MTKSKTAIINYNYFDDLKDQGFSADIINQYFNPPMTLTFGNRHAILKTGTSDDIEIYETNDELYVLSRNNWHNYLALSILDKESLELVGDCYLDSDNTNGAGGMDDLALINYLQEYIY